MKNANTRFVRVLALVLVVLMVVPAALVGCGSNKANNAAISEALAAAEAARKEAEEAKAAADAAAAEAAAKAAAEAQKALEEANKKAEEAIKAAEQAKKDAEQAQKDAEQAQKDAEEAKKEAAEAAKTTAAPATTAPVTTAAPTGDMKVVSDYAYQVLSDKDLDFLKTYLTYAYGKDADGIAAIPDVKAFLKNNDPANTKYTSADVTAMEKLYDATIVAIYQANTVDYINQLVANFVAAIAGTPTYVERVVAAYEAIDFASDYDVLDVVYANALVTKALGELVTKDVDAIKKYGEDEINLVELIYTEYYRYTGVDNGADTSKVEADDILYKDMYDMAKIVTDNVIGEVYALFNVTAGAELDVTKLVYAANIEDLLEDAQDAYTKWNNKYFTKSTNEDLKAAYEAFRQAFVGEDYVLEYENDYAWDALTASATRVEQLLAAAAEAKDFIKAVKNIAALNTIDATATDYFKYDKQISKVTETDAKLAEWMAKYDFKKDANGNVDENVTAIIGAATYAAYEKNALAVKYFAYLENTASSVNVDAFVAASEEDLSATVDYVFNFKKYGAAVASALDWYLGKEKTTGTTTTRVEGFTAIVPEKDFADLGADFAVAKLIADNNPNLAKIFEDLFDIDITKDYDASTTTVKDSLFDVMEKSYAILRGKKDAADDINDEIEELLELGATVKVLGGFAELFVGDYDKFAEADEDDKAAEILGGDIKAWANGVIVVGDENFMNLIDWDSLDEVYANYKESLKTVIADSEKVVLEYIAWQAAINGEATYNADDEEITFTYGGKSYVFSDLKPAQIDIYSYSRIKNVIALEKTLEDLFDSDDENVVNMLKALTADVADDEDELKVALTAVVDYCAKMVNTFYLKASAIHSKVEHLQRITPLLAASYSTSSHAFDNAWKDSTNVTADILLEIAMYGRDTGTNKAEYEQIKGEVKTALDASTYKLKSATGYGTSAGTTASGIKLWPTSFQGAIYSVDPINYVKRNANADDKITGFDAAAYKAALNTAITTAYNKFVTEYVKDATRASEFTLLIKELTTLTLNYGLWTIEGDVVIDDETYTYTINSIDVKPAPGNTTGVKIDFNVYDSADEKVTADIALKIDNVPYAVKLVPNYDYDNGIVTIVPTLTTGAVPATKKDVYDLLGLKKADLTYDIRNFGTEIAANFMKVSATPAIGYATTVNYQYLKAADLQTFFKNEITNDFYATFGVLRDRVYKSSGSSWAGLGNYITGTIPADVKDAINTVSKLERSYMHGMTPEANTIADLESEFNKFATRVKAILTDNGYNEYIEGTTVVPTAPGTYIYYVVSVAADNYETLTFKTVTVAAP